jgi:hypothetical protein
LSKSTPLSFDRCPSLIAAQVARFV